MISKGIKNFCNEDISLIENYDKAISDLNQTWQCHHRRELETPRKKLIEIGEYYQRPASELIFLTKSEHRALHNKGNKYSLGKLRSDETKLKMSEAHKNMSEETRKKLSEAQKGNKYRLGKPCSEETKQKISNSTKCLRWFNNGIKSVFVKECPEGFVRGRLKKVKQL